MSSATKFPEIDVELMTTISLLIDVIYHVRTMFAVSVVARGMGVQNVELGDRSRWIRYSCLRSVQAGFAGAAQRE